MRPRVSSGKTDMFFTIELLVTGRGGKAGVPEGGGTGFRK